LFRNTFEDMPDTSQQYEAVIGLEVHAQLSTRTKLFCGDTTLFGQEPNTQVSAISLGHPGTLPKTNKEAVRYAIMMGLACGCTITRDNYFARKNYFYPDLPKGYQISQHTTPICTGGTVEITTSKGQRAIQLNRIHLEEDAGKSIHDIDPDNTLIDLNRAGTPLIEIVTEPDLHTSEEAYEYVTAIRKLVRWLNICDGNMEEGSLRCDANISVRPVGSTTLGTKVEVKNLNSIRNLKKAIDVEIARLIKLVDAGEPVIQQTRSFDADTDTTFAIRDKEDANDYRYFPDPDLAPFHLTDALLKEIEAEMPALPNALLQQLQTVYGLNAYDAAQVSEEKANADYFLAATQHTKQYKAIANWMMGPLKQLPNQQILAPKRLAELIELVESGAVNFSIAAQKLLPLLLQEDCNPAELATQHQLIQVQDNQQLDNWVNLVLANMPEKVAEYKKGKKGLIGLFVGEVKKLSKGQADPKLVTQLLEEKLTQ